VRKKIKVVDKQVKEAEAVKPAPQLKEEDRVEEQRLFQDVRGALDAHLAVDARWTEQQHQAEQEQSRAGELREVAKHLQAEVLVLEAAASAGEERASALLKSVKVVEAERAASEQKWSEAVERWEKFRYSLGLPFYDPEVGPPAWFTSPYEQQGLSKLFSAP
jgi:hypothetical protein